MATKLFLRETADNAINGFRDMLTTAGSVTTDGVVNTAASGTQIQWTDTAGGAVLEWISGRAPVGGFTLSGTMTFSIWARENNMNANCGARSRVFKRTAAGSESEIGGGPYNDGVEFGTAFAEMVWTGAPTSTAFAENDRLIIRYYITNVGTMAAGFTCTINYDAADAATGDSFFQINETVAFKAEDAPAINGTMAAAESGVEDFTASGGVAVAGSFAATETGADDFTATGGVAVAGSLAVSEAGLDDFTAAGTVTEAGVTGTLAATESGSDTFAGAGAVPIAGTLAATETGADVFTAAGTVAVAGSLSITESGTDSLAVSGTIAIQGAVAAVESGADDFTALGALAILGAFAAVEVGADSFIGTGSTTGAIGGTLSASETGSDEFTGSGLILLSGALEASETGPDGFTGAGTVSDLGGIMGDMAAIETGSDVFLSPVIIIPVPEARHTQVSPRIQVYPPINIDAGQVPGASRTTVVPKRSA